MLAIGIGIAENAGQEGFKSCNGHWKGYCLEEAGRLYQQQAASDRSAGAEGGCVPGYRGGSNSQSAEHRQRTGVWMRRLSKTTSSGKERTATTQARSPGVDEVK